MKHIEATVTISNPEDALVILERHDDKTIRIITQIGGADRQLFMIETATLLAMLKSIGAIEL
jgi:hypothetical protein